MSKLVEIKSENFHRLDVLCRLDTKCYNYVFLYKDELIPIPERVDTPKIYTTVKFGKLVKDSKEIDGILLVDAETSEEESTLVFIEKEKKSRVTFTSDTKTEDVKDDVPKTNTKKKLGLEVLSPEIREAVIAYANYPFLPLTSKPEKLKIPQPSEDTKYSDIDLSDLKCSKKVEPYVLLLEQMLKKTPPNGNLMFNSNVGEYATIWKEYKYSKMKELMDINPKFYSKVLSSCCFLSIEILREYPSYKWSWSDVSRNPAIPIRDIMNNRDLPWDDESIISRDDISLEILDSMGIDVKDYGKDIDEIDPKTRTFSALEIAMSPEEPTIIKYGSDIDESVINDAVGEFLASNPTYLSGDDIDSKLEKLRIEIITIIRMEGEFNIGSFELPIDDNDYHSDDNDCGFEGFGRKPKYDSVVTEDDPLGISDLIEKLKSGEDPVLKMVYEGEYKNKTGYSHYSLNHQELVKNRSEYIELLKSRTKYEYDNLERYCFFEPKDAYDYPIAFGIVRSGKVSQSSLRTVLMKSGKLTPEYVESSNLIWDLKDLVNSMPHKFVIENLLFFPTRIHLPYIKENLCLNGELSSLAMQFTLQDEKAMEIFISRNDFDIDIPHLYPGVQWKYTRPDYEARFSLFQPKEVTASLNSQPTSFDEMSEDCDVFNSELILSTMTLTDLKTRKGVKVLNQYLRNISNEEVTFENISKMTDANIYKKFNNLHYGTFFQSLLRLTVDDIKRNSSFKFNFEVKFDFFDFLQFYKKKLESGSQSLLIELYLAITNGFDIRMSTANDLLSAVFFIEKHLFSKAENKAEYYNRFVEGLKSFNSFLSMFDISSIRVTHFLKNFKYIFTDDVVKESKYTYLDRIQLQE